MLSLEEIKHFGMPTVFDQGIDRSMAENWNTIMIPISKMVDYHKEGVTVKVVSRKDIEKIYTNISTHLQAWKSQIERGINIGNAPIDDLIAMDEFANTVYAYAKYQFTRQTIDSLLAQHMSSITMFNKFNILKKKEEIGVTVNGDVTTVNGSSEPILERESMTDIFKNSPAGIRRWSSR